jgi:hypothetical protein
MSLKSEYAREVCARHGALIKVKQVGVRAARRRDITVNHPFETVPRVIQFPNTQHGHAEKAVTDKHQRVIALASRKLCELLSRI